MNKLKQIDNTTLWDKKELIKHLNELRKDEVILIDEDSYCICLKSQNIIIIESLDYIEGVSFIKYSWNEYIETLKKI